MKDEWYIVKEIDRSIIGNDGSRRRVDLMIGWDNVGRTIDQDQVHIHRMVLDSREREKEIPRKGKDRWNTSEERGIKDIWRNQSEREWLQMWTGGRSFATTG